MDEVKNLELKSDIDPNEIPEEKVVDDLKHPTCCQDKRRSIAQACLLTVPTVIPLVGIGFLIEYAKTSPLQVFMLVLFVIFSVCMILLGLFLLELTNESSVSGMVAQRFHKLSYCCILLIAGVTFFTSCFILAGGIAMEKQLTDSWERHVNSWTTVLGTLSPLIVSGILIFPIVVWKTPGQLGFNPRGKIKHQDKVIRDNGDGPEIQITKRGGEIYYEMRFFHTKGSGWHHLFHAAAVGVGLLFGFVPVIYRLVTQPYGRSFVAEMFFSVIAIFACFLFGITGIMDPESQQWSLGVKRLVLFVEYLGLYYYMMSLIVTSIVFGGLIEVGLG